jgi:hypothetical protein
MDYESGNPEQVFALRLFRTRSRREGPVEVEHGLPQVRIALSRWGRQIVMSLEKLSAIR